MGRSLNALAALFDDAQVTVDTGVTNASRICKLYGTTAHKGDGTSTRPHRMARLLTVPDKIEVASVALLTVLAGLVSPPDKPGTSSATTNTHSSTKTGGFDIDAWVWKYIPDAGDPKSWSGGPKMWSLPTCPFSTAHTDGAFVGVRADGKFTAGCRHNSCRGKNWHDLREKFEPAATRRSGGFQFEGGDAYAMGAAASGASSTPSTDTNAKNTAKNGIVSVSVAPKVPAFQPFPVDVLPGPIRLFTTSGAEAIGCDTSFIALPVLVGLASAIGNTYRVLLKRGWSEPSILWMVHVADSGSAKTPGAELALGPVRKRQSAR